MSETVVDNFPRRRIALAGAAKTTRSRRLWLIGGLLLLLVPLYVGYTAWQRISLRADLRERGVSAEVLDADGSCSSRRGVTLGCSYAIRYRLRDQEGGEVREGSIYVPGEGPRVFAPPARYDPADPSRIMSEAEIERGEPFMNIAVPVFLFGGLSLLALLVWYAMANKSLARAAGAPRPVLVPIDRTEPVPNTNVLRAHFRWPDGSAGKQDFPNSGPLFVQSPGSPDAQLALGLVGPRDRPILLRHDLSELDLTDEERAAILAAARG